MGKLHPHSLSLAPHFRPWYHQLHAHAVPQAAHHPQSCLLPHMLRASFSTLNLRFPLSLQEQQRREWVLVCNTIYLTYSRIIFRSEGAIFVHIDAILALIMQHYHNCILEKVLPAYSPSPTSHFCHLLSYHPRKRCLALSGSQGLVQ